MKKSTIMAVIATMSMLIIFMVFIIFVKLSMSFDTLFEMDIEMPDLSSVSDGTYEGFYELFPLSVSVHVTVENHVITAITIAENSIFFDEEVSSMITSVIDTQSLDIPVVEAHKYSSKVLLLAIEDAIERQESAIQPILYQYQFV